MVNQFDGMTDISFTYDEFEEIRAKLVAEVNSILTDEDKRFLLSFKKVHLNGVATNTSISRTILQ